MSLSKLTNPQSQPPPPNITDLPVDVLSQVFEHLPLAEVLRTHSLVCKIFYEAHRQHCRSSVKRLSLVGRLMVGSTIRRWRNRHSVVAAQAPKYLKERLFKYARSNITTGDGGSPSLLVRATNPSRVHLKLVPGMEALAFVALGRKFQSVTHLELLQLALERHYKLVVEMIAAWGAEGGGANQLADVKVFFSKELFTAEGTALNRRNNNCCLAYLFAQGLSPATAPALRRVTLLPDTSRYGEPSTDNYNKYRGPQLAKIDLSQLEALHSVHFNVCRVSERLLPNNNNNIDNSNGDDSCSKLSPPPNKLRSLSISLSDGLELAYWNSPAGAALIRQLTAFKVHLGEFGVYMENSRLFKELVETLTGAGAHLRRLTVTGVGVTLSKLAHEFIGPLTTVESSRASNRGVNRRLEQLRVHFTSRAASKITAEDLMIGTHVRFQALTSLHLVKTNLVHSKKAMKVFPALFPALVHLRLDGNFNVKRFTDVVRRKRARNGRVILQTNDSCRHCCRAVWMAAHPIVAEVEAAAALNEGRPISSPPSYQDPHPRRRRRLDDLQQLTSTTAEFCKAAFVERALAAWPSSLATISLQIEDFAGDTLHQGPAEDGSGLSRLAYVYRCETITLRDVANGGELVPEADREWKVNGLLY